jgi:hypothetical protein
MKNNLPLGTTGNNPVLAHRKPESRQRVQDPAMGLRYCPAACLAQSIGVKREGAPCRQGRIQLPDAAGRTIAWIHQRCQTEFALACVVAFEVAAAHVDLTPDLKNRRGHTVQAQRNAAYCPDVLRDVLSGFPIAPGCTLNQDAFS